MVFFTPKKISANCKCRIPLDALILETVSALRPLMR